MSPIEAYFQNCRKPPALTVRDVRIQQLVESYEPLYRELCLIADAVDCDLSSFVRHAPDKSFLAAGRNFLNVNRLPNGCQPLTGAGTPQSNLRARRLLLMWAAHKTEGGGFTPYARKSSQFHSGYRNIPLSDRIAEYTASVWRSSRGLDFSWGAVSRTAFDGLEGSYRSHQGKMFEEAVREAVRQVIEAQFLPYKVSQKESVVVGKNGRRSRIDIVVEAGERLILIPCKSSQVDSKAHSPLFFRDIRDSLSSIGAKPSDVLVAFGGEGWDDVIRNMEFRHVLFPSPYPLDDEFITTMRDAIQDTGIFNAKDAAA